MAKPKATHRRSAIEALRKARETADISQEEISRRLNIGRERYSKWELRTPVPVEFIPELSRILNIDPSLLLAVPMDEKKQDRTPKITESLPNADSIMSLPNARLATDAPEVLPWTYARNVPVMGVTECGDDGAFEINTGDPVKFVPRPPGIVGVSGIYAIYTQGDSMGRLYKPNQLVYVHPRLQPTRDCDVVVQLRPALEGDNPRAFLKTFLRRDSTGIWLKQWQPEKEIFFPADEVLAVHRVLTLEELLNA